MKLLAIALAVFSLAALAGCREQATVTSEAKSLTLKAPHDVTIIRGETAKLTIELVRENFADPVKIKFGNLPDAVKVVGAGGTTVAIGPVHVDIGHEPPAITGDRETYTLEAGADAPLVSDTKVLVSAKGPDDKPVTVSFALTVKAKP
ncbi:MAG: hypothetical protein LLG01_19575 [Planctomycetaceae bacterium]|nr:hypothetical protein [Planctomycetaceae bacterium]